MYARHLGLRTDCHRVDVVGMGCNAGLNGLNTVSSWVSSNPGKYGLLVCCEINSSMYVNDDRVVTGVVNSLFGDGCGAALLFAGNISRHKNSPRIVNFCSHLVPEAWKSISYHWSEIHGRFELYLDRSVPEVIGQHASIPLATLLSTSGLKQCDISHWIIHAGGKKVVDSIALINGISEYDVRHTRAVLRDFGNQSSASFLFSYERLVAENVANPGDYGVMITMGPGVTVETALLQW